jgi:hypothetical protein
MQYMLLLLSNSDLPVSCYVYTHHGTLSVQELIVNLVQSNFSYIEVSRSHSN